MFSLLLAPLLLAASPAPADDLADVPVQLLPPVAVPLQRFAVGLDVGVPDGAGFSLAYRPWRPVRFHAGLLTNGAALGGRGGVTLLPFAGPFTPTLTLEGGRMARGDLGRFAATVTGMRTLEQPLFENLGYDFANAHAGLEFGSPQSLTFFVRAGLSHVRAELPGMGDFLRAQSHDLSLDVSSPVLRLTAPSAKVGLVVYFR